MKITILVMALFLAGCGVSQKQLKDIDAILEKSKQADCDTIHTYLNAIQVEIQKKIK